MIKVAVGIIRVNSSVLICQRKGTSRYPLKWEFPGGKLEADESAEDCLRRELREELSIDPTVGKELYRQQWHYADSGAFEVYYRLVPFYTGMMQNNVFEQIRWADLTELSGIDMLEGNKAVLDKLLTTMTGSGVHD